MAEMDDVLAELRHRALRAFIVLLVTIIACT